MNLATAIPQIFSNPTLPLETTILTSSILNPASQFALSVVIHKQGVEWENITGATNAVWEFENDSTIRSTNSITCLIDDGLGIALMAACNGGSFQLWDYHTSGNLINRGSKNCLTAVWEKPIGIIACGAEGGTQIFELPSGVKVIFP